MILGGTSLPLFRAARLVLLVRQLADVLPRACGW